VDTASAVAALLDPTRLAVAGALVGAAQTVDQLVQAGGRSRREVLEAVATLRQVGLATESDGRFTIEADVIRQLGRDLAAEVPPMDRRIGYGMTDEERTVLARFFTGTELMEIPANRSSRLVVLQRLAIEFEPGHHYPESEVNEILGAVHEDTAALRRYLVDEGFLDRSAGTYWRSGGRIDLP
jgi:hypothetical protein